MGFTHLLYRYNGEGWLIYDPIDRRQAILSCAIISDKLRLLKHSRAYIERFHYEIDVAALNVPEFHEVSQVHVLALSRFLEFFLWKMKCSRKDAQFHYVHNIMLN